MFFRHQPDTMLWQLQVTGKDHVQPLLQCNICGICVYCIYAYIRVYEYTHICERRGYGDLQ